MTAHKDMNWYSFIQSMHQSISRLSVNPPNPQVLKIINFCIHSRSRIITIPFQDSPKREEESIEQRQKAKAERRRRRRREKKAEDHC
jgi:competence protein ComGF